MESFQEFLNKKAEKICGVSKFNKYLKGTNLWNKEIKLQGYVKKRKILKEAV